MEIWKEIKNYEGLYEISSKGRVKSLARISGSCVRKERLLKLNTTKDGYSFVSLSKDSKQKSFRIHRLVAEAFIPNPDNKETVNHKDGDKSNNHIENLEWATREENIQHSYDLGLKKPMMGGLNGNAKLSKGDILFIRENYKKGDRGGFSSVALGKRFGVSHRVILLVASGKSYRNIK